MLLSDDAGILDLDSDPDVHRYLGGKPIKTIEEARSGINYICGQYERNGIGRWAVIEKATEDFIGWGKKQGFACWKSSTIMERRMYGLIWSGLPRYRKPHGLHLIATLHPQQVHATYHVLR